MPFVRLPDGRVAHVSMGRRGQVPTAKDLEALLAAAQALDDHIRSNSAAQPEEKTMDEKAIEQEIQYKGLTAPRLTPLMIDAAIAAEDYHVFPHTQLTVCCLTLQNGFTVTGESACASPENFNAELGRKIARDHARDKIWALEGYLLKHKLANG
jgi:hypothetical protein